MPKVYHDKDANLDLIKNKKIAIIGYGIQGRAQALNLRDSGLSVIVSELAGTENFKTAIADNFKPIDAKKASQEADIIQVLTQDHIQALVYKEAIEPNLNPALSASEKSSEGRKERGKSGKALVFSHGFNIHFKQIVPPKDTDVFMVAPKGPGALVRQQYTEGKGVPCLVAIYQNPSGKALEVALAYAKGIGGTRAGVIETTFKEETETDLFGEQAVLCGGVSELVKAGYDTLIEAGYQPEIAYFECLHELKLITDLIYSCGIQGMRKRVSDTAEYGDLTRGKKVINENTRKIMKEMLKDIQTGKFAKEWIEENKKGRPVFSKLREEEGKHPIEEMGKKLRAMMPWMKE